MGVLNSGIVPGKILPRLNKKIDDDDKSIKSKHREVDTYLTNELEKEKKYNDHKKTKECKTSFSEPTVSKDIFSKEELKKSSKPDVKKIVSDIKKPDYLEDYEKV